MIFLICEMKSYICCKNIKMKIALSYLWIGVLVLSTSCVSNQDMIYLQKKEGYEVNSSITAIRSKPYRLQTNDVLSVAIKAIDPKLVSIFSPSNQGEIGKSESALYFDGFSVDDHGNIRMPVLGEINVIGYTVEEVRDEIERRLLADYFNEEASLFVTVKLAGFKYTITGEVGNKGTKVLFQDHVNIMDAIANSGDINTTGNRKDVTIIRQLPTGTEMHTLDLTDINVMNSPYYYLQPNDFIYVKPLKKNTWGNFQTGLQGITSIASLITLGTTVYLLFKN
jgi:polysaccharide export outer membrane protein